jgi:hypothetical protein
MSLIDQSTTVSLDYAWMGSPFVSFATTDVDTTSFDYSWMGSPFVIPYTESEFSGILIFVDGGWQQATGIQILINGAWQEVSAASIMESGAWETIF